MQSFIAADAARVFAAVRERTDLLFDGLPAESWPAVDGVQEPYHFTSPWPFTQAAGGPTKVSVTLHDMGGGVRVDVRHEGWGEGAAWDTMIQGHFAGWLQGLAALGLWLETGIDARQADRPAHPAHPALRTADRYFISGGFPRSPPPCGGASPTATCWGAGAATR